MDGQDRMEFEDISVEEIREMLARAGFRVSERQAKAIFELVRQAGGVHNARVSLEAIDAMRDAA